MCKLNPVQGNSVETEAMRGSRYTDMRQRDVRTRRRLAHIQLESDLQRTPIVSLSGVNATKLISGLSRVCRWERFSRSWWKFPNMESWEVATATCKPNAGLPPAC